MHDPMTVAFEIKAPWRRSFGRNLGHYHPALITIWHVDPEKGGNDDSCDFSGRRRKLRQTERALFDQLQRIENLIGNDPFYSAHKDQVQDLYAALWTWRSERRRFRWSPRWHVHHWKVVIEPWATLRRWLFDRCCYCGKGFGRREARYGSWGGERLWHARCDTSRKLPA